MLFKLSEATAARRRFIVAVLVDAGDGLTAETGESGGQPQISKNGEAFANTAAILTAIGNGSYYVSLSAGELDTLGTIHVRYKSGNTAEWAGSAQVVAFDPFDSVRAGLSALAQSAASLAAVVAGDALTIHRGDTVVIALTNIGDLTGRSKLWFTLKRSRAHTDAQAILQIEETVGLIRLNGAAGTAGDASLVVDDVPTGDITIALQEVATDDLVPTTALYWDVQVLVAGVVTTLVEGEAAITADVTRAVA